MLLLDKIFGTDSDRYLKKIKPIVTKIIALKDQMQSLSDGDLQKKTEEFKKRIANGETLDLILPEAFSTIREAARRTTGMYPFDVQLIGGITLHQGSIAEMHTGEGKTLVAILPAYLNALMGKGVHIVTVNDYLARRDAVWMGQAYAFLGLSVSVINSQNTSYRYDPGHREVDAERDTIGSFKIIYDFLVPISRKEAYEADITYGTNNEFAFDYLRDNIAYHPKDISQRGFSYAIVDEVDSILIDEARSPLIISSPTNIPPSHYQGFAKLASVFKLGEDFTIDEKQRAVSILPLGVEKAEKALQVENIYVEGAQRAIHYLQNALRAKSLFIKNKQYVVRDNKVVIVDEFTGRLQPGRQWSEGLHQAIEAKEKVPIQKETRTYASITFQNYFRLYNRLAGMTGTATSSAEEFYKVYNLPVIAIPSNTPIQRIDKPDSIYQTEQAKFRAVVNKVQSLHQNKQPVLVGTASIEHNERLSKLLKKAKVPHEVLNAKNHEREGEIIAQAGKVSRVTIATNLAGRGVDIQLGGTPYDTEQHSLVKSYGGLFVIGTERHEARRIDNQLRGRSGRQGDEGETQFFVSMEDSLIRVFGGDRIRELSKRLGLPEDQAIENKFISNTIEGAQKRIEGHHFDARRYSLEYDTVLNSQRKDVYKKRRCVLMSIEGADDTVAEEFLSKETIVGAYDRLDKDAKVAINQTILRSIDYSWVEHIEIMDYARSSTNLRSYGQREPLLEYRRESVELFKTFWKRVSESAEKMVSELQPKSEENSEKQQLTK